MKLFQYGVILHPTDDEKKAGKSSVLVLGIATVLAGDQNGAVMQAARAIPEEHMDKLDRLEVAVRPF